MVVLVYLCWVCWGSFFKKWARLLWVFCFVYCAVFFCGGGLSSAGGSAVCSCCGAFSAVLVHRCVSWFSFRVSLGPYP